MRSQEQRIKRDVLDHLLWDTRIDASDVSVSVSDGEVQLSGTFPTYAARKAAEKDAMQVRGVTRVIDNTSVQIPAEIQPPSDENILININNLLKWSASIAIADVDVSVHRGIVTLRGAVDMYWKKHQAEELAYEVVGVAGVQNQLVVTPARTQVDRSIAQDISETLLRSGQIDLEDIDIVVEEAIVTLRGRVPDGVTMYKILYAAEYTRGVVGVVNELEVDQSMVVRSD
ncbi:MAG: BON domain-containing protein [Chitinivibrionales bacterium]